MQTRLTLGEKEKCGMLGYAFCSIFISILCLFTCTLLLGNEKWVENRSKSIASDFAFACYGSQNRSWTRDYPFEAAMCWFSAHFSEDNALKKRQSPKSYLIIDLCWLNFNETTPREWEQKRREKKWIHSVAKMYFNLFNLIIYFNFSFTCSSSVGAESSDTIN